MTNISLTPTKSKIFTAKQFLNLKDTSNIKKSVIIPPILGKRDLGKIEVTFKHIIYERQK